MGLCICCSGSNNTRICKEEEKQALLCFKEESKILRNWVDRADCCTEWEGVVCDNVTGHVIELHLSTFEDNLPRGKLSSCLLEVKQLRYLDLSGLNFSESHIPNFIGSFVNLQYIDLSSTSFEGIIPHQLGNLSQLHTLHLRDEALKADSLDWLSSLSNLKVLDLTFANLSMVHNWAEVINMLPSLRELYLTDISKLSHPLGHNKSSLQVLDLANNEFNTVIFRWIFNFDSLISLQLYDCGFQSPFPDDPWNLTSLRTLDISANQFHGHLPNSLWNLTSLRTLDISANQFHGHLPNSLWNLTSLRTLDISANQFHGHLPNSLWNLTSLRTLDISANQFHGHLPNSLWNLTSLRTLDISANQFHGHLPNSLWNLTSLRTLDISANQFHGHLPNSLWNLTSLRTLDISANQFHGHLPNSLWNLTSLRTLDISANQFHGHLPNSLWNLTSLSNLYISANQFHGHLPNSLWNLTSLSILYISGNQFHGHLPNSLWNLTSLSDLDLSENMFTGEIPKPIGKLNKLQRVNLYNNKLDGPLPENLGYSFPMLENLNIMGNMLEGIVTENHFVNLTMLGYLQASGNRLTLNVSLNWIPPFQLLVLYLSGWKLGPQFPTWLQYQHSIVVLDISNAGIQSEVPSWFWRSFEFRFLNLSHNQLRGKIHTISVFKPFGEMPSSALVYLSSNQFNGPLPRISSHTTELDLSNNFFSEDVSNFLCQAQSVPYKIKILHLGGNRLFGEIPNCWMHWPQLKVINMGNNQLIGSIPNSIGLLDKLKSLDMHKNMLFGPIPPSLQNCTLLLKIDLGENGFTGKIPRWLGTKLLDLTIFRLRSNKFYGELPLEFCHLKSLRILDLSNNNLSGVIPWCLKNLTAMINEEAIQDGEFEMGYSFYAWGFGESAIVTTKGQEYEYYTIILLLFASMDLSSNNFSGDIPIELANLVRLRSLNLSRNNLIGNIPMEMGNMRFLESLDLSRNQLSGEIPTSFSSLSTLEVLDLSYNNLSGKIPSGTQLQGFNDSCYIGNNLCGPPLLQSCSVDDGKIPKNENEGDDSSEVVDWFYVSMAIGFAVGFWAVCGSLFLVRPWRIVYFQFLDDKLKSFLVWAHALMV
ncbi:PREDICTED: receptor like protein 30-like [Ipomoea nil]|uniref:receptor like protein 30-like n=1 Tax=Ipomoea nil TaxID=35883 RepID=UPI000901CE47|nr:PREDICTED: receptor like protein 30-like [Ipomoea nil]